MEKVRSFEKGPISQSMYHWSVFIDAIHDASVRDCLRLMRANRIATSLVSIDHFELPLSQRGNGLGTLHLKTFCDNNSENVVLVIAGVVESEIEDDDSENKKKLARVLKFYESRGFVNCNDQIGNHETQYSLIYNNTMGSRLINSLRKG